MQEIVNKDTIYIPLTWQPPPLNPIKINFDVAWQQGRVRLGFIAT